MSIGRGNICGDLNLDFIVPPFLLIFWRAPGCHALQAFSTTALRDVTVNCARRKIFYNRQFVGGLNPYIPEFVSLGGFFFESLNLKIIGTPISGYATGFADAKISVHFTRKPWDTEEWLSLVRKFHYLNLLESLNPKPLYPACPEMEDLRSNPAHNGLKQHRETCLFGCILCIHCNRWPNFRKGTACVGR